MTQSTTSLPTVHDFIASNTTAHSRTEVETLARLLDNQCYGTLSVLLLLTPAEVRSINSIGTMRVQIVAAQLRAHALTLRDSNESLARRAVQMFGSIDEVPIQALALRIGLKTDRMVVFGLERNRITRTLVDLDGTVTLGMFMSSSGQSTQSKLQAFLLDHGDMTAVDPVALKKLSRELEARLMYWEKMRAAV